MTGPMHSHEPSPEFRAHLEWQLETALRRESRLAEPVTAGGFGRLRSAGTALLVVLALVVGGAAGIASEHMQDAQVRDQVLANTLGEMELATVRLELARAEYQEARRRFDVGAVGSESLAAAERRVRALEAALKRLQLDMEEAKATSATPRNELNAPLVGQRDFVRDRLMLDLQAAEQELVAAEQGVRKARERTEIGLAQQATVLQAEAEMALARDRMQKLQIYMELRKKYLQDAIKAEDLVVSVRRAELTVELARAQRDIEAARQRNDVLRKLLESGLVSALEVKRAEVELLEAEVKLQSAQRQLNSLPKKRD